MLEPDDLSACRVIFGEADQFPGLTVDRFGSILVTQTLSVGMEKLKPVLFPILAEVLRADGQTIDGIYERNDEALRAKEGLEQNKAGLSCPAKRTRPPPRPRSARTAFSTTSILRTARRPASSSTRSTTAVPWPALQRAHGVGLLYSHRQLCAERGQGRAARVTAADISAEAIAMQNGMPSATALTTWTSSARTPLNCCPGWKRGPPLRLIILDPPAFTKPAAPLRTPCAATRRSTTAP